jgi:hypothetical protein
MPSKNATPKQRLALHAIDRGIVDHASLPDYCAVQGGYANEAVFLMRMLDRGYLEFSITPEGYQALGYVECHVCRTWHDPELELGHTHDPEPCIKGTPGCSHGTEDHEECEPW